MTNSLRHKPKQHEQDQPGRPASLISLNSCFFIGLMLLSTGCPSNKLKFTHKQVLESDISKEQLVEHLNRNILGTEDSPGLAGWRTSDAKIQVTGIPFPLPASMAVEAPRNLRIVVSHPITGGQEVDLGSNRDRFWLWTKEQPEMIVCNHEDASHALQHLEMPIQIQPEWLVEVFGVIPIEADDYTLERPQIDEPVLDLVSVRTSPTGHQVERVIRVNTFTGRVQEHLLRSGAGDIIASATLKKYTDMPNGTSLPTSVRISWPEAKTEMKISLGHPSVNPPSFATANSLWEMPNIDGARVVDIGKLSRQAAGEYVNQSSLSDDPASNIRQLRHSAPTARSLPSGRASLAPSAPVQLGVPEPITEEGFDSTPLGKERPLQPLPEEDGIPEWAKNHSANRPIIQPEAWQRSEYSGATWRSSSAPRPQELE